MPNYANMGFVGYFQTIDGGNSRKIRVTSADIKATQSTDPVVTIDGYFDPTAYKLGPVEISGSIAFPAVYDNSDGISGAVLGTTPASDFFDKALLRTSAINNTDGRLVSQFGAILKYYGGKAYQYNNCVVDTYDFSVNQGDLVQISCGLIATDRQAYAAPASIGVGNRYANRNTRSVTWNDFALQVVSPTNGTLIGDGAADLTQVRSFKFTLANNSQRVYGLSGTFNTPGTLTPFDIVATKRAISGSFSLAGIHSGLAVLTSGADYTISYGGNVTRCNEDTYIRFGYRSCGGVGFAFDKKLTGAVFQIEEVALSNELVESTVNWKILPGAPGFAVPTP